MTSPRTLFIPDIPDQVDLEDLDWEQSPPRLLEEKHYGQLKELRSENTIIFPEKRISKNILRNIEGLQEIQNSVTYIRFPSDGKEHCLAWYKGKKHEKHLGEGYFGKVKLVQDQATGKWYAMKVHIRLMDEEFETDIMKKLGFFSVGYESFSKIRRSPGYHQLMEYIPEKTLYSWLSTDAIYHLPDTVYMDIILSCMISMEEMHRKNVFHGDIDFDNIFYDIGINHATLWDFGKSGSGKSIHEKDINDIAKLMKHMLQLNPLHVNPESARHFHDKYCVGNPSWEQLWQEIKIHDADNQLIRELENRKNIMMDTLTLKMSIYRHFIDNEDENYSLNILKTVLGHKKITDIFCSMMNISFDNDYVIRESLIRDDSMKKSIQIILDSMDNREITLSQTINALTDLRRSYQYNEPNVAHTLEIREWNLMTDDEKSSYLNNFSFLDKITLTFDGLWPTEENDRIVLLKNCVEIKRQLSKLGFYSVSNQLIFSACANEEDFLSIPCHDSPKSGISFGM